MAVKKKAGPKLLTTKTKKVPAKKGKGPGGRHGYELDYETITKLAERWCTREEIADILGVSKSRLDKDELFREFYKKGRARSKASLRRAQLRNAIHKNNAIMQIWLGKNILNQKDTPDDDPDKPKKVLRFRRVS